MKFKFTAILTLAVILHSAGAGAGPVDTPSPTLTAAATPTGEGYHGVGWGTSLDNFKSAQKSSAVNAVKKTEATAIAYVMMNFHPVAKDDNYRPTKLAVQKTDEDKTSYVFYDGRYQLAVTPIELANLNAVQKEIGSKYSPMKDSINYSTHWDFSDKYGWTSIEFDYQRYLKTPGTRIYLVTASTYLEDKGVFDQLHYGDVVDHSPGPKTPVSAYLIYVSEDYFKSSDNAWVDYQATVTIKPESTKVVANPTPTPNSKENSKQQDLKSVE
jgi:hypothetical protein